MCRCFKPLSMLGTSQGCPFDLEAGMGSVCVNYSPRCVVLAVVGNVVF